MPSALKSGYWLVPVSWALVALYLSPRIGQEYTPDSYACYLLGANFLSGLGYVSQAIRDFYLAAPEFFSASRSFPPAFPLLTGLVDRLTGSAIASGVIVNGLVLWAMLHVHFRLSARLGGRWYWIAFLLLPAFIIVNDAPDSFAAELVAGRSIPLTALLVLCVSFLACTGESTARRALFLGLALGLLYLTRFDTLLFCALAIAWLAFRRVSHLRWVACGLLIAWVPWLVRNTVTFGEPLASDNMITVLSTHPSLVQISWFADGVPIWRDNPSLWATQRIDYLLINAKILVGLLAPMGSVVTLAVSALALLSARVPEPVKALIAVAWLWTIANVLSVSLTPYHNLRYFSVSALLLALAALLAVLAMLEGWRRPAEESLPAAAQEARRMHGPGWRVVAACLVVSFAIVGTFTASRIRAGDAQAATFKRVYDAFKSQVGRDELVAYGQAEHLAYYSRWRTIYPPRNAPAPDKVFIAWKSRFNVRYAIVPDGSPIARHPQAVVKGKVDGAVLVDLAGLKDA